MLDARWWEINLGLSFKMEFGEGQLTYPEFPFESEAKGDNLIGVQQTKTVKNWKDAYNFNSWVVLGIKWLWEYLYTGKRLRV